MMVRTDGIHRGCIRTGQTPCLHDSVMSVTCTPSIQADIKYDGAPHYSISPTDYPQTDGRTDEPPDERKQAPSDLSNVRSA